MKKTAAILMAAGMAAISLTGFRKAGGNHGRPDCGKG